MQSMRLSADTGYFAAGVFLMLFQHTAEERALENGVFMVFSL